MFLKKNECEKCEKCEKCIFESNDVKLRAKCSFCGTFDILTKILSFKKMSKKCQNDIVKVIRRKKGIVFNHS